MSRIIYLPLPNAPKPLQADTLVMSNGLFALGRLAQSAVGLKNLVMPTLRLNAACFFKPTIEIIENQQAGKMRGVETVYNAWPCITTTTSWHRMVIMYR